MTFLNNKRYFVLSFEAKEALAEQPLSLTSVQVLQLLSGNVQVHHLPVLPAFGSWRPGGGPLELWA